jgi:hypothetical protein
MMKRMKRALAFLSACAFAFALTGCAAIGGKIEDTLGTAVEGVIGGEDDGAEDNSAAADNDAKVEKHNAYIDLYNALIGDVNNVVEDYAGEFGFDDAVYIDEGFDGFSMYSNSLARDLATAMEYVDKSPSEPSADAALRALEPVLLSYATALTDAKTYYADKNYVDDDFEKAQQYHEVIVDGYDPLWEKIDAFLIAVNEMLEGQDEEQLAIYEEANWMIHYYALLALVQAQEIDSYLGATGIYAENLLDVNIEELRPLYDAFVESYTEYNTLVGGDASAGKDEDIMTLSTYNSVMSDLKASLSELVSRVQSGSAFDESDVDYAYMTDGTPENITELVDDLLSAWNTWIV